MKKRVAYFIFLLLLLTDTTYSFLQFMGQPLDGDMAWCLVPANEAKKIFENPLGVKAILYNETYANPNRFFCHWTYREYLISMPLMLQKFADPITSVYLACALSKTVIQLLIIFLSAIAISGTVNMLKVDFMMTAALITPLFQTNGYQSYMGIIDPSTTYTFFYALPAAVLLLYFLPLILQFYHGKVATVPLLIKILWIPLAFVVCLSGPLNPGIILVCAVLLIMQYLTGRHRKSNQNEDIGVRSVTASLPAIPGGYLYSLLPVCLLSVYSLFLGRYNVLTINTQIPLAEMYLRLPEGLYYQFTQKLGFPVLLVVLALNVLIIRIKYRTLEGQQVLNMLIWIGIFTVCYVLLLPLGGYRSYRPYILRYDTIMPVTLSLIFIFGVSTFYLFRNMSYRQLIWYVPVILTVLFIYTNSDEPDFENNKCEMAALQKIAGSVADVIEIEEDCSVVDWRKTLKPEDSELNAQLLTIWRITDRKKLYYNK